MTEKENEEIKRTVKNVEVVVKCKECGKAILKKHISEFHPKNMNCDICHEKFDQLGNLKIMQKLTLIKNHIRVNICYKGFLLHWRLKKHIKQNVKFCHFFTTTKLADSKK